MSHIVEQALSPQDEKPRYSTRNITGAAAFLNLVEGRMEIKRLEIEKVKATLPPIL